MAISVWPALTLAQAPPPPQPPTRTIEQLAKTCKSETPRFCERIIEHARKRYGDKVLPMQWQSSVRAVGYQMSQGR
jgi:hypothetical protein